MSYSPPLSLPTFPVEKPVEKWGKSGGKPIGKVEMKRLRIRHFVFHGSPGVFHPFPLQNPMFSKQKIKKI